MEIQGDWIVGVIRRLKDENLKSINATKEAEDSWRKYVTELSNKTLFPGTSSWYMGANIPGKPREQLNYAGGLPLYQKDCKEALHNWKGFEVA